MVKYIPIVYKTFKIQIYHLIMNEILLSFIRASFQCQGGKLDLISMGSMAAPKKLLKLAFSSCVFNVKDSVKSGIARCRDCIM